MPAGVLLGAVDPGTAPGAADVGDVAAGLVGVVVVGSVVAGGLFIIM